MLEEVAGSFRDPGGHVYKLDGRILRSVAPSAAPSFEAVCATGLLDSLIADGRLLSFETVEVDELAEIIDVCHWLEVPHLRFVSYPYEWPFSLLKAAALLHLDVQLSALDYGVTLSDASAYNVQFDGVKPIFIDHLSFRPYTPGEMWVGHRQFCEQFLNPLLLRSLFGISHNAWFRGAVDGIATDDLSRLLKWRHRLQWNIAKHVWLQSYLQNLARDRRGCVGIETAKTGGMPLAVYRRMLEQLRAWIGSLHPADTDKTLWRDYSQTHSYSTEEVHRKQRFVAEFARRARPQVLWDLGCNTGDFSQCVLENGATHVIGFDFDQMSLDLAFERAQDQHLSLTPLFLDAANPSPNQGWQQRERDGLGGRASANGLLALALIHHLVIARNIPLAQFVDWMIGLAPCGVIEFVPKGDPMIDQLLRLRQDIFPDYNEKNFVDLVQRRARVVKSETVSASGRLLLWYDRSQNGQDWLCETR